MTLEETVNAETCLEIKPLNENTPCTVDIKMLNNQKIARICIVSEAAILEIFREYGEYTKTIFAELIEEFEGATVYNGEVIFDRPTHETSINVSINKHVILLNLLIF